MLAPPNGNVWHRAFFRWVRAQGCSPHAPGISKNAYGLVCIPLIRGASGAGRYPTPKEVKAWPEGPLKPKEISMYRDTLGQIRAADNTTGRSATRHMERCRTRLICLVAAKSLSTNNGEKSPLWLDG